MVKAIIIIPQHPAIPDWLTAPAAAVAFVGGYLLALHIRNEPTPSLLRKERKEAAMNHTILKQNGERAVRGDG